MSSVVTEGIWTMDRSDSEGPDQYSDAFLIQIMEITSNYLDKERNTKSRFSDEFVFQDSTSGLLWLF